MIDVKELFKNEETYLKKEITVQGWIKNHRKQSH